MKDLTIKKTFYFLTSPDLDKIAYIFKASLDFCVAILSD